MSLLVSDMGFLLVRTWCWGWRRSRGLVWKWDLDEIKRLLMVRTAGVVVGVFGHLVNPALHHLAGGRRVRHLFPPHEDFGQFCHHRVLDGLGQRTPAKCQVDPGHVPRS